MKLENSILIVIFFLGLISVNSGDYAGEAISKTQAVLASSKEVFANLNDVVLAMNPGKIFSQVSKVLGALGPAAMAISAVLSIVAIFIPKEDSPELKAIKAGFEKVNNKLDIITSKIGSLENIIELSSARAAYVKTVTTINNNFEALTEAQKENTKEGYDFFAKQYENTFEFATANMYDAMTGSTGPFGFNMVNLYKTHVKCNPVLLIQFCTMGMHLITKGLSVEGAYLGYLNFTAKAKAKTETWQTKMEELGKQCSAVIENCESSWKDYAYQQYKDTYRELAGNNQAFAERLAKDLDSVAPQRSWLTVIYNDASGFGEHTFSTYYETEKIWDQKEHDTTIFSTPKKLKLEGAAYDNFFKIIDFQHTTLSNLKDCQSNKYRNNEARSVVEVIREKFMFGVVYSVALKYSPGQAATGSTLYTFDQKWTCNGNQYRVIVFQ